MITFFTTAKPFEGANKTRQINAIRSWQAVHPDVEVLLFGRGAGYAETVAQLGLVQVDAVATNEFGIPRIDSMFALAAQRGRHAFQAYINCDIVLLPDYLQAVRQIPFGRFLMVAQRYDVNVDDPIDFSRSDWATGIRAKALGEGQKLSPCGIDVFLEKGRIWRDLPPMVVGRGMYDNWLIYYCRSHGIPVVDGTDVVTLVHQNHDYRHIVGGKGAVEVGSEANRNLQLGGGYRHLFTIQDADWRLTANGLYRNWYRGDSRRCGEVFEILHENRSALALRFGRCIAEAGCEWIARWRMAIDGQRRPLGKYPGWLVRRIFSPA